MRSILLILILIIPGYPLSGQMKNNNISREVIINSRDSVVKIEILTGMPKRIKLNDENLYYWYHNNQIGTNYGGFAGSLLHGKYELLSDKKLVKAGYYEYGLKSGTWYIWTEKGQISSLINYKDGKRNGYFMHYDINGIRVTGNYLNGEMHGPVRYCSDDSTYTIKYKHGIRQEEGTCSENKITGKNK